MERRPYKITKKVINNITRPVIFNIVELNDKAQVLCKLALADAAVMKKEVGLLCEIHMEGDIIEVESKWSERLKAYVIDVAENNYHFNVNTRNTNSLMFIRTSSDNSDITLNDILNLVNTDSIFVIVVIGYNGDVFFAYKTIEDTSQYRRIYHDMQANLASVNGKIDLLDKIRKSPNDYGLEIGYAGDKRKRHLAQAEHISIGYIGPDEYDDYIQNNLINFRATLLVPYCSAISTDIKEGEHFSSVYATEDEYLAEQVIARKYLLRGEEVPDGIEERLHQNYLEIKDYI